MRKSGGCGRVEPDLGQDRCFDLDALWHVQEDAAAPEGCVLRCIFIGCNRHAFGHKVFLHQFGIFAHGAIQVGQDHALSLEFLVELGANDRAIVLDDQARALTNQGLR